MFVEERQAKILDILKKRQVESVRNLSKELFISGTSIRRDLERLEKLGFVKRTHGGAIYIQSENKLSALVVREKDQEMQKKHIAFIAASLINDGETIILDSSSTSLKVPFYLKDRVNLTVVTNGARTAVELASLDSIKTYCCGGQLMSNVYSYNDSHAQDFMRNVYAHKAFFSCKGISMKQGVTCVHDGEAEIRKCIIKNSVQNILLCDSSKFDHISTFKLCDFKELSMIITDKKPSDEWIELLKSCNVELRY